MLKKLLSKKKKDYKVTERPADLQKDVPMPHGIIDIPDNIGDAIAHHDKNIIEISQKAEKGILVQQTARQQLVRSIFLQEGLTEEQYAFQKSAASNKIYIWDKEKVKKDQERKQKAAETRAKNKAQKEKAAAESAKPAASAAK